MKPTVRHILSVSVLAVCLVLYVAGCRVAAVNRRTVTCGDLDPIVADSLERRFVTRDDIRDWMADYGTWVGLPLDSVNLELVETIINGKSAVRDCQAWLTDNGVLHVSITQREPIVRFQSPAGGFYADAEGFLFPLQNRHTARVPVVDGALPVRLEKGFKGMPRTEAEKAWTGAILNLVRFLSERKEWNGVVGQINVRKDGNLVLIPREGPERFLFGTPTGIEAKFGRIRRYYEAVAPVRASSYHTVDVRFDGQIVCK